MNKKQMLYVLAVVLSTGVISGSVEAAGFYAPNGAYRSVQTYYPIRYSVPSTPVNTDMPHVRNLPRDLFFY